MELEDTIDLGSIVINDVRVRVPSGVPVEESNMGIIDELDKCNNLIIVAHPDDESLWGGAHLIYDNWFIICLTNGDNKIRSKEFHTVLDYTNNYGAIMTYPDLTNGIVNRWFECKDDVKKNLTAFLTCKNWDIIVTHNPNGETGHTHHLLTNQIVTGICEKYNLLDKLYYFGKFYDKGKIPEDLPKLSDKDFLEKKKIISIYKNEAKPIALFWKQMIPYENWIFNKDWEEDK